MFSQKYKRARTLKRTADGINLLLEGPSSKAVLQLQDDKILQKLFPGREETDDAAHRAIPPFLDSLLWKLTNESGAEYKYYQATLPVETGTLALRLHNFFARIFRPSAAAPTLRRISFHATLIEPASERQIQRTSAQTRFVFLEESKELYARVTKGYIQSVLDKQNSLSWLFNVIEGKKERERILFQNDIFLLNVDTKWRTHPDCRSTPREEWKGHPSTEDLYCLAIVKERGIASLRDLRGRHIPLLTDILDTGRKTIEETYGVPKEELRVFIHYLPQFYHLHVHFTRLFNTHGSACERAHLLPSVIDNLTKDPMHYANANLYYTLPKSHHLVEAFAKHQKVSTVET